MGRSNLCFHLGSHHAYATNELGGLASETVVEVIPYRLNKTCDAIFPVPTTFMALRPRAAVAASWLCADGMAGGVARRLVEFRADIETFKFDTRCRVQGTLPRLDRHARLLIVARERPEENTVAKSISRICYASVSEDFPLRALKFITMNVGPG
jgi:hypothetical protein